MREDNATVYVVDDDPSVREGLDSLLRSVGYRVSCFASTQEFSQHSRCEGPACLILDVRMPGPSGLDYQAELANIGDPIPIIFITGHGDVPMSVRAVKAGAIEFLLKPFREQELLDAVREGIDKDRALRLEASRNADVKQRFATLTTRERQVMAHVVRGRLNKQIAGDLGLSEITVKVHRAHAMRKMQATSLADLIRMGGTLGSENAQ